MNKNKEYIVTLEQGDSMMCRRCESNHAGFKWTFCSVQKCLFCWKCSKDSKNRCYIDPKTGLSHDEHIDINVSKFIN